MVSKFGKDVAKKLSPDIFKFKKKYFLRNVLMDAHKVARGALRGAAAESGQSASGRGGEMLLMVEEPEDW